MKSKRIYMCFTYYHVLISLIKEMLENYKEADIVICDTIPEYEKLVDKLNKSRIFNNVFLFSEKKYKEENKKKSKLGKMGVLFTNIKFKWIINPTFDLGKTTYKEVNIFNDWTYLGHYLRAHKIYYNLLEDAKDSYKVLDNYVKIDYYKPLKHRIFGFVLETLYFHGKSKYSKIVEVNDDDGIKIAKEKIRVKNKNEMFNTLTDEQKQEIYKIFLNVDRLKQSKGVDRVLILTQPLFEDSMVESEEVQRKVYQDILDTYCNDLDIVIKPHPRDNFDYEKQFNNVHVMGKNIPTEVLNFNSKIKYEKAITVSSSSINGIDFVDEKIYLGFDFLKKYQ